MYRGGVCQHGEAGHPFIAGMQPPGLRLPRSPPRTLTLLAARQHIFESFNKGLKHVWYLIIFHRQVSAI